MKKMVAFVSPAATALASRVKTATAAALLVLLIMAPISVRAGFWTGWTLTDGGYPGVAGSCQGVTGTFTVPVIGGEKLTLSIWVGLDGYSNEPVEQIGVDCISKSGTESCYLWWELYPSDFVTVKRFPVHPGDSITLTVFHDDTGNVMMCAQNNSSGQVFWTIQPNEHGGEFSSAEWIVETFYPAVPRFGTVQWTDCAAVTSGSAVFFSVNENSKTLVVEPLNDGEFKTVTSF